MLKTVIPELIIEKLRVHYHRERRHTRTVHGDRCGSAMMDASQGSLVQLEAGRRSSFSPGASRGSTAPLTPGLPPMMLNLDTLHPALEHLSSTCNS